jgi:hypothetical protein
MARMNPPLTRAGVTSRTRTDARIILAVHRMVKERQHLLSLQVVRTSRHNYVENNNVLQLTTHPFFRPCAHRGWVLEMLDMLDGPARA